MSILSEYQIDPEDFEWRKLALCQYLPDEEGLNPLRIMFEDFHDDADRAEAIKEMCRSCPVRKQCLEAGIDGKEYGVWGGEFLTNGEPE
jgi:hypothetical protein